MSQTSSTSRPSTFATIPSWQMPRASKSFQKPSWQQSDQHIKHDQKWSNMIKIWSKRHTVLQNIAHFLRLLHHVASCCIMLHHVASCCIMLHHVASCLRGMDPVLSFLATSPAPAPRLLIANAGGQGQVPTKHLETKWYRDIQSVILSVQNLRIWIRTCRLTNCKLSPLLTNTPCCWGDDLIVPLTVPLIAPLAVPVTIPLIFAFPTFKVISQSSRPDIHWHSTYWSQWKSLPVWKLGFGGAASSQTFCKAVFLCLCPILNFEQDFSEP